MNKMGILINNPDVICILLPKISGYLQDKQNSKVYKIRKSQEKEAELSDLTFIIDEETILVNDTLFSQEALGQYLHKPDRAN